MHAGYDDLLSRIRHLVEGVDSIGRSRYALSQSALSVFPACTALTLLGIGLSWHVGGTGTAMRTFAPLLVWGPLTLIVTATFVWRGPSSFRWGWWSALSVVLVVVTVALFGSIALILTLCLLPIWHVVNRPATALVLSAGCLIGLLCAVIWSRGPVDLPVALRALAVFAVLTIMLQVIMRHVAGVSAAAEVLADDARRETARLEAEFQRAKQQEEATLLVDEASGVLTPVGLERRLQAGEPTGQDTRRPSSSTRRLVVALQWRRWSEVYAVQSPPERHRLSLAVGARLRKTFGPTAIIGRMGSAEFVIVVPQGKDVEADRQQMAWLLRELAQPVSVASQHVLLQPVMGICRYAEGDMPLIERVQCAEVARDVAVRHQIERPVFFEPAMREEAADRVALAARIAHGITAGEFALYYQPIVDVTSGKCRKAEGLLRWHHPDRGVLTPGAFLGIAEEHGLSALLLEWTAARACEDLKRLRESMDPEFRVALNVSPEVLVGGKAGVERLESQLSRALLPKDALVLEVTEAALVTPSQEFIDALERLRDLGVLIALDDFGTGHSTLARLAELPIDILKVDRLLVMEVDRRPRQATILRGVIALARDLGLQVTVEGVETEAEWRVARAAGCQETQGFVHAPAVPLETLSVVIQRIEAGHAT